MPRRKGALRPPSATRGAVQRSARCHLFELMGALCLSPDVCRLQELKSLRRRVLFLGLLALAFAVALLLSASLALAEPGRTTPDEVVRLPGPRGAPSLSHATHSVTFTLSHAVHQADAPRCCCPQAQAETPGGSSSSPSTASAGRKGAPRFPEDPSRAVPSPHFQSYSLRLTPGSAAPGDRDYASRSQVVAPNLRRLRKEGTVAEALIPVYPSKTFPNHYSIATGPPSPPILPPLMKTLCFKSCCWSCDEQMRFHPLESCPYKPST